MDGRIGPCGIVLLAVQNTIGAGFAYGG